MTDAPRGPVDDGLSASPTAAPTEQEAAALADASTWVGGEVSAVGLGKTDDGSPAIIVYAGPEAPDLPAEVDGLPVQVVLSGPMQALDEKDSPEA